MNQFISINDVDAYCKSENDFRKVLVRQEDRSRSKEMQTNLNIPKFSV